MESNGNKVVLFAAGALALLVLLVGGVWFVSPFLEGDPAPKTAAAAPARSKGDVGAQRKRGRPQMGRGPVVYQGEGQDPAGGAPSAPRGKAKGGGGRREESRAQRTDAFNTRLDAYAKEKGWDPATTEQVREAVLDGVDGMRQAMAEGRRAGDREAMKAGMQEARAAQQTALVGILGADESAVFTSQMDLGTYFPMASGERRVKAGNGRPPGAAPGGRRGPAAGPQ